MSRRKFTGRGPLAITAEALGVEWESAKIDGAVKVEGEVAILEIRGPTTHHTEIDAETGLACCDSYDMIIDRARACFESNAARVLMSIDSPGGEVSGLFDTARTLAEMAAHYGKPLHVYVDGQACSAAYALACASSHIYVPTEGRIGSIGVIAELWNEQRRAAAAGYACTLVTSGARKADGHPQVPHDDAMIAAVQKSVDEEAAVFWAWVAERRPITLDEVKALEAGVFHAAEGIERGLGDEVATYYGALGLVPSASATGPQAPAGAVAESKAMAEEKDDMDGIRAKLGKKAAEDSDDGRRARKALEAMDAEGEDSPPEKKPEDEPDGDEGEDSAEADDAEDEATAATAAEDDGAEDDAAAAKRAEDDAKAEDEAAAKASKKAEEADARAASATTLAAAHKAMREAKALRNRAAAAKARGRILNNQARLFSRTAKALAPKPKTNAASKIVAGLAASASRGTEVKPNGGAKPPTATTSGRRSLADVAPEIRRAAGIQVENDASDPLVSLDSTGMSIGARFCDPSTARAYLAGKAGA